MDPSSLPCRYGCGAHVEPKRPAQTGSIHDAIAQHLVPPRRLQAAQAAGLSSLACFPLLLRGPKSNGRGVAPQEKVSFDARATSKPSGSARPSKKKLYTVDRQSTKVRRTYPQGFKEPREGLVTAGATEDAMGQPVIPGVGTSSAPTAAGAAASEKPISDEQVGMTTNGPGDGANGKAKAVAPVGSVEWLATSSGWTCQDTATAVPSDAEPGQAPPTSNQRKRSAAALVEAAAAPPSGTPPPASHGRCASALSLMLSVAAVLFLALLPKLFRLESRIDLSKDAHGAPCGAGEDAASVSTYIDSPLMTAAFGAAFLSPLYGLYSHQEAARNLPLELSAQKVEAALLRALCLALGLFMAIPLSYDRALHQHAAVLVFLLAIAQPVAACFFRSYGFRIILVAQALAACNAILVLIPRTWPSLAWWSAAAHPIEGFVPCADASPWLAECFAFGFLALGSVLVAAPRRDNAAQLM